MPAQRPARVVALALALAAGAAGASEPGQPAPDFEAPALRGDTPVRLSGFRGKVVYLDFWASWCAPCLRSLPWMQELYSEFRGRGLEIVAVNVDEDPDDGRKFLSPLGVMFAVVSDPEGGVAELYNVPEMPTSFVIDRDGIVRHVHRGFDPDRASRWRENIAALLGEP